MPQDFANERKGRGQVWLHYIPWDLVLPSSTHRLQLVACFSEVRGVLVDVFGAIVHLWPPRRHHDNLDAFLRVN